MKRKSLCIRCKRLMDGKPWGVPFKRFTVFGTPDQVFELNCTRVGCIGGIYVVRSEVSHRLSMGFTLINVP